MKNLRPKSEWMLKSWDGYRLVDSPRLPEEWGARSNLVVELINAAGHKKSLNFRSLYYIGRRKGNSKINLVSSTKLIGKRYGKLVISSLDKDWVPSKGNGVYATVICDCGQTARKKLQYIMCGDTTSCGQCLKLNKSDLINGKFNKLKILPTQYNIDSLPDVVRPGIARLKNLRVDVLCDCGKEYQSLLYDLVTLRTISCGCALNESKSSASKDFYTDILTVFPDAQYSVSKILPHKELDVYVPSLKLGIEYHGCRWHSEAVRSKSDSMKDWEKYKQLTELGIRSIQIYSDEWSDPIKRAILTKMFRAMAGSRGKRIYNIEFRLSNFTEVSAFLDKHHYLAGSKHSGTAYIGAYHAKLGMLGAWVFQRSSRGSFEWKRAAWNQDFISWNPHGRALDFFVRQFKPTSVFTFSDNRLFTGSMYRHIGFVKVKELRPDYMYTNGVVRQHKFNFRVKAGKSETKEAANRNFYRIWDCGKTKWEIVYEER